MDNFGKDLAASGVVLSPDELREQRQRDGLCPTCGRKCFERKALRFDKKMLANAVLDRLEPLTVDGQVLNGRCLICNPQTQEEKDQRASEMLKVSLRSSLDSNAEERWREGELGPIVSEEDNQADRQSSDQSLTGSLVNSLRHSLGSGGRRTFIADRSQAQGSGLSQSLHGDDSIADKNDGGRKLFARSVAAMSHDDFFAQFDVPGRKRSFEEGDAPRPVRKGLGRSASLPESRKGDSHDKPPPSPKAERDRSPPRRKTSRTQDSSRHHSRKSRWGGEKARRERLSSGGDGGSARRSHSNSRAQSHNHRRSHRSGHTRSQSNSRNSLAQSQSSTRQSISSRNSRSHSASSLTRPKSNTRSDSNRQFGNGRIRGNNGIRRTIASSRGDDKKVQRWQRSEKIGKIMRKSQRNLKHARQKSRRRLKSVHWEVSGSSSSSGSDDESSSLESIESSRSNKDGEESPVGKAFTSWREMTAPQEKIQSILSHFSQVAARVAADLAGMREARSQLKEEEASANKAKWYASKQLKDAQEQQASAAEREDYEVADELGTVIKGNLKALKKQTQIYQGIHKKMAKMDEKKEAAVKSATLCLKEAQVELSELHDELVQHAKEDKGLSSQFYEESNRLSSESERLAQELKAIEKEEESFAIKKEEVIGGETKELEVELKDASTKLVKVNDTIQELRKKLETAEAEAVFLKKRIEFSAESIEDIHFKHSEELTKLEFKFRSTKERRSTWESESKTVEEAKSAHKAAMEAHANEVETRKRVINMAEEERSSAVDLEKIVADAFNAEEEEKAQDDNDDTAEVDEIIMYEALVDEKQELLFDAEKNIMNLFEEISTINARVPVLEAKKKKAASASDFKRASKASSKIKKALARREQCQQQLNGGARQREQAARDEFERYTSLLEAKTKAAEERGREAGMKRIEQLRVVTSMLRFVESKLADEEGEALFISAIGGVLINAQRLELEAEGRALGEKYGGWEGTALGNDAMERLKDAVERFPSPLSARDPSLHLVPERRTKRTRLSLLLDEKICSRD